MTHAVLVIVLLWPLVTTASRQRQDRVRGHTRVAVAGIAAPALLEGSHQRTPKGGEVLGHYAIRRGVLSAVGCRSRGCPCHRRGRHRRHGTIFARGGGVGLARRALYHRGCSCRADRRKPPKRLLGVRWRGGRRRHCSGRDSRHPRRSIFRIVRFGSSHSGRCATGGGGVHTTEVEQFGAPLLHNLLVGLGHPRASRCRAGGGAHAESEPTVTARRVERSSRQHLRVLPPPHRRRPAGIELHLAEGNRVPRLRDGL